MRMANNTLRRRICILMAEWHESGRDSFEAKYPSLDYDEHEAKVVRERKKYIALDVNHSGAWLIDKTDGMVYNIKAYGRPDKKKCLGHIDTITGANLDSQRWWSGR